MQRWKKKYETNGMNVHKKTQLRFNNKTLSG